MLSGFDREMAYEAKRDRERAYEAELAHEEALAAERREEDASIERYAAAKRTGVSDEEFEIREEAFLAARQRGVEFVNAEISRIFVMAAATAERRAA